MDKLSVNNSAKTHNDRHKRILFFGLDGANWKVLKPIIDQGKLPTFKKLINNGVHGSLRSVNPPVTFPAWATMFTGKNPASLGAFYFLKPNKEYELKVSPLNWKKWNPIWDIYSKAGRNVCVFNIPTTTAYKINGKFISGPIWGEDDEHIAFPPELSEYLKTSGYQVRPPSTARVSGDRIFIEDLKKLTEIKFNIYFDHYLNFDWDLFMLSFNFGDTLQHYYWKYFDEKHPVYSKGNKFENVVSDFFVQMDKYLRKLLDNLPENTTLIMTSDHGQKIAHTYLNLNAWLYSKGFLKPKVSSGNFQENLVKKKVKNDLLKILYSTTQVYSNLLFFTNLSKKSYSINIQKRLKTWLYMIENKVKKRYKLKGLVDWPRTKAYCLTLNTIYLNLEGRENMGCVKEEDYENIREDIINELKELKDPTNNEYVINKIWTKEQVYPKNPPSDFPDIYLLLNEGYINYYSELQDLSQIFHRDIHFSAEHSLNGIFIAYGPEIRSGEEIKDIGLEDIVPTTLHLANMTIPNDIDGRVVEDIFKEDSETRQRRVKSVAMPGQDRTERGKIRSIKFSKKI